MVQEALSEAFAWAKGMFRGLWRLVLCVIAKGCRSGARCLSVEEAQNS